MEALTLEQVIPERPEFKLRSTGDIVHRLRLPNLEDRAWIRREFGSDATLEKMLNTRDWAGVCRLVYRLLEDKSQFPAEKCQEYDDDGFQKEVTITGHQKLFRSIQDDIVEAPQVLAALTKAIMDSNPVLGDWIREEIKKKSPYLSPVGESSSIPSQPSTDGDSITSALSR